MKNQSDDGRQFIMLPTSLLPVLSDTALRIILYAVYRERLVELGYLKEWCLYLTDIEKRFGNLKGYSLNTVRKGIRELAGLNLIILKGDHYDLNVAELKKWFLKDSRLGLSNSGRGVVPKSGRELVPKSGRVEKRDKEKRIKKGEGTVEPISKNSGEPPVACRTFAETFAEIFPESKDLNTPTKTTEQLFDELFPAQSGKATLPEAPETTSTVSEPSGEQSEKMSHTNSREAAQTTPATDPKRRHND
jgi:hypothetical protein